MAEEERNKVEKKESNQWQGKMVEKFLFLLVLVFILVIDWLILRVLPGAGVKAGLDKLWQGKEWFVWLVWLVLIFEAIFISAWFPLIWSVIKRWLADRVWFWGRFPEMRTVNVMKDRKLRKIIINCSSQEKRERIAYALAYAWDVAGAPDLTKAKRIFEELRRVLCENLEETVDSVDGPWPSISPEALGVLRPLVFLGRGQEVYWIGVPWIYTVHQWVEDSVDADRREPDPHVTLNLRERIIDMAPPDLETADRVQVKTFLVIRAEVVDSQKAIWGVTHFTEALKKEIEGEWRQVLSQLRFFEYGFEKEAKEETEKDIFKELVSKIHTESHAALVERLGIGRRLTEEERKDSAKQVIIYPVFSDEWYQAIKDKSAGTFFNSWGIILRGIEVRDIDPTDRTLREAFQERIRRRAEYLAAVQKAEAIRISTRAPFEGEAEGLKAVMEALAIDGYATINRDILTKALEKANITLIGQDAFSQLLGLAKVGQSVLSQQGKRISPPLKPKEIESEEKKKED